MLASICQAAVGALAPTPSDGAIDGMRSGSCRLQAAVDERGQGAEFWHEHSSQRTRGGAHEAIRWCA